MGAAWCRERAAQAHDSKSPLDRVIVSCVDKVYPQPKTTAGPVIPLESDHRQRTYHVTSLPAVHTPRRLTGGGDGSVAASGWQSVDLQVPRLPEEDSESIGPTPVPPPRKKRRSRASAATSGAAARVAAASASASASLGLPARSQQRSVSTVVPPTIRTDDSEVRVQKLSTVSLPDYQQLDKAKQGKPDKHHLRPGGGSGTASSFSSISEATVERLDEYMRRCRSFGSVNTEQLVEQLVARSRSHTPTGSSASSSDAESDDSWGISTIDNPIGPGEGPPLTPTHRLSGKRRKVGVALSGSAQQPWFHKDAEPRDATDSPSAFFPESEKAREDAQKESELREVRKELQSIVYDFNLYGSRASPTRTDLEILPTQPITQERKKKISIKSITPPPSPELTHREDEPFRNGEDTARAEVFSKILSGYEKVIASAAALKDTAVAVEAEAVLRELGVPSSLEGASSNGHSRRSSMTPSLSELEATISDLLEQTQAAEGDDDAEDSAAADNRINNILENGDKNMRSEDGALKVASGGASLTPDKSVDGSNEAATTEVRLPEISVTLDTTKYNGAANAANGAEKNIDPKSKEILSGAQNNDGDRGTTNELAAAKTNPTRS